MTSTINRLLCASLCGIGAAGLLAGSALAQTSAIDPAYGPIIARPLITSGLNQPLFVTAPPGETRWLFVVQKGGTIRLFDRQTRQLAQGNFLAVSPITTNSERGLLGMAFHPHFANNGFFFVNFTNGAGHTVIRRYTMTTSAPYSVVANSALDLLTIPQDYANHNAGWLGFSPIDGFLYIPMGDGGSGNDPLNRSQDRSNLLGAVVRIDVDGDDFPNDLARNYRIPSDNPFLGQGGRPEIWAYGLRNPWRNSFDRETGDLWIADVGQSSREEVNFQSASSPGGQNYGWRLKEGTLRTHLDPEASVAGLTDPIYEYDFSDGSKSIAGGYVYRGQAMPQLRGHYFFADYVADFVKSFRYGGSGMVNPADVTDWTGAFGNISNPASFGEDGVGELFIVSLFGQVYEITQSPWFLWRNQHFTHEQIVDAEVSGAAADPRGDGIPNLLEYALGLDPWEPAGGLPLETGTVVRDGETFLSLRVGKGPGRSDVAFTVEATGTLDGGGWTTQEVVVLTDNAEELHVRDSIPLLEAPHRFLRLRVELD